MSRRRFPLFAAALTFPLLTAATCGDNLPGPTVADYLAARELAGCARLVRCGVFLSVDDCVAYFPELAETELERAVTAGTVTFAATEVTRCLESIAEATCDETRLANRDALYCFALLEGTASDGSECSLDDECTSGACATADCEPGACCRGTCVASDEPANGATGTSCRADTDCQFGTACVGAGIDPGVCRELPLLGEACPYRRCAEIGVRCEAGTCVADGAGSPCTTDSECSVYNRCTDDRVCGSPPALGDECDADCLGNAFCRRPSGGEPFGVCTAPQTNGEPCLADDECESRYCSEGAFFDTCADRESCF